MIDRLDLVWCVYHELTLDLLKPIISILDEVLPMSEHSIHLLEPAPYLGVELRTQEMYMDDVDWITNTHRLDIRFPFDPEHSTFHQPFCDEIVEIVIVSFTGQLI